MIEVLLSAHLLLQTAGHAALPEASSILDHYVKVTASPLDKGKKLESLSIEFSVTDGTGAVYYASVYRDRNRHLHTATIDDAEQREWGAASGHAWAFSKKGAQLMTGKAAERVLAETHGWSAGPLGAFAAGWGGGFLADDWREAFPSAKTVEQSVIRNQPCFEIVLTRKDGSTLRRWYEVKSGLLEREIASEFDASGAEQTYETDVTEYATALGFTYPAVLHTKAGSASFTVKINSFGHQGAFELPREVAKAIAKANTPEGMPSAAAELIERFAQLTGGAHVHDPIRSQVIKAKLSLGDENLKIPMVLYAAGRQSYFSLDIPTMGKFEFGSNGQVAWQRSVVMGPELLPRPQARNLIGPDISEILSWAGQEGDFRTVGKEPVNGAGCYVVEMDNGSPGAATKAYFDEKTGYLVQMDSAGGRGGAVEKAIFGDYRTEGSFTLAHHVETTLEGKPVTIDMSEVQYNAALPEHVFDLPEDVVALVEHEKEAAKAGDPAAAERPSLKRRPQ